MGAGSDSPITAAIKNANNKANITSNGSGTTQAWCASSPTLAAGSTSVSTFCVDNTGYKGVLGVSACKMTTYTCIAPVVTP